VLQSRFSREHYDRFRIPPPRVEHPIPETLPGPMWRSLGPQRWMARSGGNHQTKDRRDRALGRRGRTTRAIRPTRPRYSASRRGQYEGLPEPQRIHAEHAPRAFVSCGIPAAGLTGGSPGNSPGTREGLQERHVSARTHSSLASDLGFSSEARSRSSILPGRSETLDV
jgi:hypothetical protein